MDKGFEVLVALLAIFLVLTTIFWASVILTVLGLILGPFVPYIVGGAIIYAIYLILKDFR